MNHDDVRLTLDVLERVAYGVLASLAAGDDHNRLQAPAQIVGRRRRQVRRQRDNDVGDGVRLNERVDAVLEDRTARERGQLFRLVGPKAESASTRGDDG
jgi:hypothetical protein